MERKENKVEEYYLIDFKHIFKVLVKRLWIVMLAAIITAVGGFSVAKFMVAPKYSSSVMLYVNNSSESMYENITPGISASELSAAQSLVRTYSVILKNRTTLENVIKEGSLYYTPEDLDGMISASAVNDAEILKVTVKSGDPYEAAHIANTIAKVLPVRISEVVSGSSAEIVDYAAADTDPVSPNKILFALFGLLLGALLSAGIIVIIAMCDDTIHSEDYILNNYDYPVLAKVPDLLSDGDRYGYYYNKSENQAQKAKKEGE